MTNGDVFLQVLSEVTGKPRSTFKPALKAMRRQPGHRLDEHLSDAEAAELLAKLRKEKQGILNWLVEGTMIARRSRWARRN